MKMKRASGLQNAIQKLLPDVEEVEQTKSPFSGLLAKVAYADLNISAEEEEIMTRILEETLSLDSSLAEKVVQLAKTEMENFAGVGSEKYGHVLGDLLATEERYQILLTLFQVAAAEGGVSNLESETIRSMSKGLLLENRHFAAARASVQEKLNILNKK